MEACAECNRLERHLGTIGVDYLCATQQRDVDRRVVDRLRRQLDEAEEQLDRHCAAHDASPSGLITRLCNQKLSHTEVGR